MFSNLSFSSISLATETPSLVTVGAPKRLVEDHVATFGAQSGLDRVSENVYAGQHALTGFIGKKYVFCRHCCYSFT
jgi:hypothetical protein